MKSAVLFSTFVTALVAGTVSVAAECSVATLKGTYTYWSQGADATGKISAEVGQEVFDGAGNITTAMSTAGSAEVTRDTGTYTVNADCTATSTYASGASYTMHVAPSGDSFVFASTSADVVAIGENSRVAP